MSLVHEPLIQLLNRHFVSCHFNVFKGPGYDAEAVAFLSKATAKAGASAEYGVIATPEGELVAAFGYQHDEVLRSFRKSLQHPLAQARIEAEKVILAKANENRKSAEAQFAASELLAATLDAKGAIQYLDRVLDGQFADALKAEARFRKGRVLASLGEPKDRAQARKLLEQTTDLAEALHVDTAAERFGLDVELDPKGSFFPGYRLKKGVDAKAMARELEQWLAKSPAAKRSGQLRFYLGLAQLAQGDKKAADKTWKQHFEELPNDRFALLSRVHHSSYEFAPGNGGIIDPTDDPEVMKLLEEAFKRGVNPDGSPKLTQEEQNRLIELLRNRKK